MRIIKDGTISMESLHALRSGIVLYKNGIKGSQINGKCRYGGINEMNLISAGMCVIIVGIFLFSAGVMGELDKKFEVNEGTNVMTIDEGFILKKYKLNGAYFADRSGPAYIIGVEAETADPTRSEVSELTNTDANLPHDPSIKKEEP